MCARGPDFLRADSFIRILEVETSAEARVEPRHAVIVAESLVWIAVFDIFIGASLCAIHVEHTKAVGDGGLLGFLGRGMSIGERILDLAQRQRDVAFVTEELDLATLVLGAGHHASTGEEGVVDRVRVDVSMASGELDVDDDEVIDVLHVFANATFAESSSHGVVDHEIACGASSDLVGDVAAVAVLVFSPPDLDLFQTLVHVIHDQQPRIVTYALVLKIYIVALAPSEEISRTVGKTNDRTIIPENCTDDLAALEDREQVLVSGPV